MLSVIQTVKKFLERFMNFKKQFQKTSQTEFTVRKLIREKGDKLFDK